MRKAVIILSGGLDSTTLAYEVTKKNRYDEIHAITYGYGQTHHKEIECAKITATKLRFRRHHIVDISDVGGILHSALTGRAPVPEGSYDDVNQRQTVVPNRNMIMLSIAAGYAMSIGATDLYYGAHTGDHVTYPDCSPEFIDAMNAVLVVSHYTPIRVMVPFLHYSKGNIVAKGLLLDVPYQDTWTCYKGGMVACGKCGSCIERLEAFEFACATDPLEYEV